MVLALLFAVMTAATAERLPIKHYTTADGLPCDYISRIVRDSHGYLWFCTIEGLSRFDGYRFVNYGEEQGLPSRSLNALIETRSGDYWIATDNGVCRFNPDPLPQTGSGYALDATKRFIAYHPGHDKSAVRHALCEITRHDLVWDGCGSLPARSIMASGSSLSQISSRMWMFP